MTHDESAHPGDGHEPKSTGQLVKEVTEDISSLVRMEIDLAKQEIGEAVSAKVKGAVAGIIAGVVSVFALVFLFLALRDGLSELMWTWAASLVTAGALLLIAAGGAVFAASQFKKPVSTELTKQSIKEDVEMAKSLGKRA
jgi:uncharacterized membrane protein YqjE